MRVIVPIPQFQDTIDLLQIKAQQYDLNISCLIPIYKTSLKAQEYNINRMLGYFRRKFLNGEVPTILSNDCSAGRFYEFLGLENISPTCNVFLNYEDFLKLCSNPLYYFDKPLENLHYSRFFIGHPNVVPHDGDIAFYCDDIEILFVHDKNPDIVKERWDYNRTHYNKNRFMYLLARRLGGISQDDLEKFFQLDGNKLILSPSLYEISKLKNCGALEWNMIYELDRVIENSFDLVGWFNEQN